MNSGHKILSFAKYLVLLIAGWLVLLVPHQAHAQGDTSKVTITGVCYNKNDSNPAALVNIYDRAGGIGTTSAANGTFSLRVPAGDTIIFSSIEYETRILIARPKLNNLVFAIYLVPITYMLPASSPFSKSQFQKDFKGMNPDDSAALHIAMPKLEKDRGPGKDSQSPGKLLSFGGNPNKVVEKQEEEIRKFNTKGKGSNKYNKELVKRATKLNDKQAEDFMKFCYISPEVVESGSEYDILVAVKTCFKSYLAAHPELKK